MNLRYAFRHLFGACQSSATTDATVGNGDPAALTLTRLQQFCASLPEGKAEVLFATNEINVRVTWQTEENTVPKGMLYWINGQNEKVEYADVELVREE